MKISYILLESIKKSKRYFFTQLALTLAYTGAGLVLLWQLNSWRGRFYDAIQQYNVAAFWQELGLFAALALAYVICDAGCQKSIARLALEWRAKATEILFKAYEHIKSEKIENVDQRIQEDLRLLTKHVATLGAGALRTLVTLIIFSVLLWKLSATTPVFGHIVPGSLWCISVTYAIAGTLVCTLASRRLPSIEYHNQRIEAEFRRKLVYATDGQDSRPLRVLGALINNYRLLTLGFKRYNLSSGLYFQFAVIVPFLVSGGGFFSHVVTLGLLMQVANAFDQTNMSISYFLDRWLDVVELRATVTRLREFVCKLPSKI